MGKGLIPALFALVLPTYGVWFSITRFDFSETHLVAPFYVFYAHGRATPHLRFFDLSWYFDLGKHGNALNPAEPIQSGYDNLIAMVFGNYREIMLDGANTSWKLDLGGLFFGTFIFLMLIGIILNVMNFQRVSGVLFLLAAFCAIWTQWNHYLVAKDALQAYVNTLNPKPASECVTFPLGLWLVVISGLSALHVKRKKEISSLDPPSEK
ncbi:MAG: hypothetical protein ACFFB3_03755 [Candidatus Hodarchaeota archaeon]